MSAPVFGSTVAPEGVVTYGDDRDAPALFCGAACCRVVRFGDVGWIEETICGLANEGTLGTAGLVLKVPTVEGENGCVFAERELKSGDTMPPPRPLWIGVPKVVCGIAGVAGFGAAGNARDPDANGFPVCTPGTDAKLKAIYL